MSTRLRLLRVVVAVLVAVVVVACGAGRNVARGANAYHRGDYQTALAEFLEVEAEFANLSPRKQFEYALYRGLTHLQIGDAAGAQYWLMQARMIVAGDPSVMRGEQQMELEQGLARLQMIGGGPPAATVVVQPTSAAPPAPAPAPEGGRGGGQAGGPGPVIIEQSQSGGDQAVAH